MPHVTISMYPGKSEEDKEALAKAVQELLIKTGTPHTAISVRITEVAAENWKEQVFDRYIKEAGDELYILPDYNM